MMMDRIEIDSGFDLQKELVHLQDSSLNMSARLTTLEGECVKVSLHSLLNSTVDKLASQVSVDSSRLTEVATQLDILQKQSLQLEDNTTQLATQVNTLLHPQGNTYIVMYLCSFLSPGARYTVIHTCI